MVSIQKAIPSRAFPPIPQTHNVFCDDDALDLIGALVDLGGLKLLFAWFRPVSDSAAEQGRSSRWCWRMLACHAQF